METFRACEEGFTGARYVFALSVKTLLAGAKESQS